MRTIARAEIGGEKSAFAAAVTATTTTNEPLARRATH
jgi:hypothetical protein